MDKSELPNWLDDKKQRRLKELNTFCQEVLHKVDPEAEKDAKNLPRDEQLRIDVLLNKGAGSGCLMLLDNMGKHIYNDPNARGDFPLVEGIYCKGRSDPKWISVRWKNYEDMHIQAYETGDEQRAHCRVHCSYCKASKLHNRKFLGHGEEYMVVNAQVLASRDTAKRLLEREEANAERSAKRPRTE